MLRGHEKLRDRVDAADTLPTFLLTYSTGLLSEDRMAEDGSATAAADAGSVAAFAAGSAAAAPGSRKGLLLVLLLLLLVPGCCKLLTAKASSNSCKALTTRGIWKRSCAQSPVTLLTSVWVVLHGDGQAMFPVSSLIAHAWPQKLPISTLGDMATV